MVNTVKGYKRTTISLPENDYEILRFVAFKRKTSVAGLVKELIQELLEDEEDIRDGIKSLEDKNNTIDWETFKRQHLDI